MMELTEVEFDILNTVYFVEPFDKILEEVDHPENIVADSLKILLDKKLVVAMRYDDDKGAYVRSFIHDSDNMRAYHYLVTREGLVVHNSR